MSALRDDNYFVIHGWMINRLGLKGSELQLYAIIYGFSQADGQQFHGGLQYLADWTNITKRNVIARLQSLVDKGLLIKTDVYTNGVKTCEYRCVIERPPDETSPVVTKHHRGGDETSSEVVTKHHRGGDETSTNKEIYKELDKEVDKEDKGGTPPTPSTKKPKSARLDATTADAILTRYAPDADALELLREWMKVREAKRAPRTEKALILNLDKLDKLARESGLTVCGYLEAVIARGWAAFFPINNGGGFRAQPERNRIKTETEHAAGQQTSGLHGW